MTFEEAKCCLIENKPIIDFKKYNEALGVAIVALAEIQQYRAIGTVEEFKDLKEKNEPKKVIVKGVMGFDGEESYCCPTCGLDNAQWGCNRCVDCGQALDWQ